jgi:hypothetical protein
LWADPIAKKEFLNKCLKIDKDELSPRNLKALQGFKDLQEYKFNKTRIFLLPGKDGARNVIVGIAQKSSADALIDVFKTKFKTK